MMLLWKGKTVIGFAKPNKKERPVQLLHRPFVALSVSARQLSGRGSQVWCARIITALAVTERACKSKSKLGGIVRLGVGFFP